MAEQKDITEMITIRNLEEGGGARTPLREFKGKLDKYYGEFQERFNRTQVHLAFTEVEVVESTEPYDFPIADIVIPFSSRARSLWGIFSKSLAKVLPDGTDIVDAVGSVLHLKYTGGHMLWDGSKETPRDAWEVVAVAEVAAKAVKVDPMVRALQLLDGKTVQQFNQAALSDPVVRSDTIVQASIMQKRFIAEAIIKGLVTADVDGVHHLIK